MEFISDKKLNGKVTCNVPHGEDVRMLKHILMNAKFINGEPAKYSLSNKEIIDFYGISEDELIEKKESLSTNLVQSSIWIKNDESESFWMYKIFGRICYSQDIFEIEIYDNITPFILGIRMGAEMFQWIR